MEPERAAGTAVLFFVVFFGTLAIGRVLKRRAGVRLGVFYRLFCLALAFYAALTFSGVQATWRDHIGAAAVLLSTALVVALINRYLFDYYYETRRQVVIPRLLREFAAAVVVIVALLVVLISYHAQSQLTGLL